LKSTAPGLEVLQVFGTNFDAYCLFCESCIQCRRSWRCSRTP